MNWSYQNLHISYWSCFKGMNREAQKATWTLQDSWKLWSRQLLPVKAHPRGINEKTERISARPSVLISEYVRHRLLIAPLLVLALGERVDGPLLRGPSISEPGELGSCGRLYVRPISTESDSQPGLPFIPGSVHNVYGQNFQAQPSGRRCWVWWPSDSVPTSCRYLHLIGFIKPLPSAYKIMIRTSFTEGWVLSEKKGGLLTSMSAELQPQVE